MRESFTMPSTSNRAEYRNKLLGTAIESTESTLTATVSARPSVSKEMGKSRV